MVIASGLPHGQGPKEPFDNTPTRAPGSIRRTTTLEARHGGGAGGAADVVLRGRDLRTEHDGSCREVGRVEVRMRLDERQDVVDITSDPSEPRLAELIGENPYVGWRKTVNELLPDHRESCSLLYLLLDTASGWMMLSRFGLMADGSSDGARTRRPTATLDLSSRANVCAGWQTGGTLLELTAKGGSGAEFERPAAPRLESADDPLAWHTVDPVAPYGSRRCRRLDLIPGSTPGAPLLVDAMFRDSAAGRDGVEGVLHEYTVSASVHPESLRVLEAAAVPRALPWAECPQAIASASQLVGQDVRGLRIFVGREMRGITTCTHLNELYRTFADIGVLAEQLLEGSPSSSR